MSEDAHATATAPSSQQHGSSKQKQHTSDKTEVSVSEAPAATSPQHASTKQKKQRKGDRTEEDGSEAVAMLDPLAATHMANMPNQAASFVDQQQAAVFAVCNSYMDLFLANQPYPIRSAHPPVLPCVMLHLRHQQGLRCRMLVFLIK